MYIYIYIHKPMGRGTNTKNHWNKTRLQIRPNPIRFLGWIGLVQLALHRFLDHIPIVHWLSSQWFGEATPLVLRLPPPSRDLMIEIHQIS